MALANRSDQQIMEARAHVGGEVYHIGMNQPNERSNHLSGSDSEELVFLGRLTDDRGRKDRRSAASQFSNVKDGELGSFRVMTEMIAKRPFLASFERRHDSLE